MRNSFLIVELAGEEWAIAGDAIDEVVADGRADVDLIDLRTRFGFAPSAGRRSVVVVRVADGRRVGLVVDLVRDLIQLRARDVEPPPDLGGSIMPRWLAGLVRYDDRLALVLEAGELAACNT